MRNGIVAEGCCRCPTLLAALPFAAALPAAPFSHGCCPISPPPPQLPHLPCLQPMPPPASTADAPPPTGNVAKGMAWTGTAKGSIGHETFWSVLEECYISFWKNVVLKKNYRLALKEKDWHIRWFKSGDKTRFHQLCVAGSALNVYNAIFSAIHATFLLLWGQGDILVPPVLFCLLQGYFWLLLPLVALTTCCHSSTSWRSEIENSSVCWLLAEKTSRRYSWWIWYEVCRKTGIILPECLTCSHLG